MKKLLSFITIILLGGMFWACDEKDAEMGEESPVYVLANWAGRDSVRGGHHVNLSMEVNAVQGELDKLVLTSWDGIYGWQDLATYELSGKKETVDYDFEVPVFPDSMLDMRIRAVASNTKGDKWTGNKWYKVYAADYTLTESELTLVEKPVVDKNNGFRFVGGKPEAFSTKGASVPEEQQQVVIDYDKDKADNIASKGLVSKDPNVRFTRVNSFYYANAKYNSVLNTFRDRYDQKEVYPTIGGLTAGDIILIGTVTDGKAKALGVMKVVSVPETNDQTTDVYRFLVKGMGR